MLEHWLSSTVEVTHWGWNALTISFLATICVNVPHAWSLVLQIRTIGRLRSGVSVSVPFFAFMTSVFFVFLCYGLAIGSLAAVLNGVLGFFYAAVLLRLGKYRRFSDFDVLLMAAVPAAVGAMLITTEKQALLMGVLGAALLPMLHQAYTLRRYRTVGAVDPRYLLVFTASAAFWTVYAFAIDDTALKIINPIGLVIQLLIVALWYACRDLART